MSEAMRDQRLPRHSMFRDDALQKGELATPADISWFDVTQ